MERLSCPRPTCAELRCPLSHLLQGSFISTWTLSDISRRRVVTPVPLFYRTRVGLGPVGSQTVIISLETQIKSSSDLCAETSFNEETSRGITLWEYFCRKLNRPMVVHTLISSRYFLSWSITRWTGCPPSWTCLKRSRKMPRRVHCLFPLSFFLAASGLITRVITTASLSQHI